MKNLKVLMVDYFKALNEAGKTKEEVILDTSKMIAEAGFDELLDVNELIQSAIEEAILTAGVNGSISPS